MSKKFILASNSPRRKEILEMLGLDFEVDAPDVDEKSISPDGISPGIYVQELAFLKAAAAAKNHLKSKKAYIIAADTIVYLDGEILGKPSSEKDAAEMLKKLSGKCHEVYTGICVLRMSDASAVCEHESAKVYFKELSDEMISRYIATKEPLDKAGAYGIQGLGTVLVKKIEGDFFNVMGLPASRLSDLFAREFNVYIV